MTTTTTTVASQTTARAPDERVQLVASIPFFVAHALALSAPLFFKITPGDLAVIALLYFGRMLTITAGYHRYFSHRSYRLARVPQFVLAFLGTTAAQKGPLWWAGHHRNHHRYADTERDVHSPMKGFWWSHVGWILSDKFKATDEDAIRDFAKFPEIRFVDRHNWIGPWMVGTTCFLLGGWRGLVVWFFLSTVLLWHATFTVNSLAHLMGRRRYATNDTSKNSVAVALLTLGEGWHNNHHYWPASSRQGFFWWEFDPTYYLLRVLSFTGLVRDLRRPPRWVLGCARIRDGHFDLGMFRASWSRAMAAVGSVRAVAGEAAAAEARALEERLHAAARAADALARRSRQQRMAVERRA